MVEGPGATRNAHKVQSAVGHRVLADQRLQHEQQQRPTTATTQKKCDTSNFQHQILVEAFSVGKEVFLLFSNESALRLHFGMNGSLALSRGNTIAHRPSYTREKLSLQLRFQPSTAEVDADNNNNNNISFVLECFGATISQVSTKVARGKLTRLHSLDACGDADLFDADAVLEALRTRPTAMISDAILDQNRFPGVGNIIKIEGLHKSNVHPKRLVSNLSDPEMMNVIEHCHTYAMAWLKSGRAPNKHVYNQTTCGTCHSVGSVRMVKLGNDLKRVTFWCESCQPVRPNMNSNASSSSTSTATIGAKRGILDITNTNTPTSQPPPSKQPRLAAEKPCTKMTCPQHGARSFSIKRVRHKEQNKNRLFGTCRVPGCPLFAWVDTQFPNCSTCRRKTVLRVSKTDRSGGRWFFSCGIQNCKGTFAWATPQQLQVFGKHLTPLL